MHLRCGKKRIRIELAFCSFNWKTRKSLSESGVHSLSQSTRSRIRTRTIRMQARLLVLFCEFEDPCPSRPSVNMGLSCDKGGSKSVPLSSHIWLVGWNGMETPRGIFIFTLRIIPSPHFCYLQLVVVKKMVGFFWLQIVHFCAHWIEWNNLVGQGPFVNHMSCAGLIQAHNQPNHLSIHPFDLCHTLSQRTPHAHTNMGQTNGCGGRYIIPTSVSQLSKSSPKIKHDKFMWK